ncbi:hypothetical protein L6164_012176 [Bauhinia variegata]|uniref:Uncharacterized protein n=1 Tax=Bauhinia variegata TaxID=167791 RepID=A0ACB9P9G3_BAUVA|nr:hypothetical protein L6164_012176 [Bauhinia variegata]
MVKTLGYASHKALYGQVSGQSIGDGQVIRLFVVKSLGKALIHVFIEHNVNIPCLDLSDSGSEDESGANQGGQYFYNEDSDEGDKTLEYVGGQEMDEGGEEGVEEDEGNGDDEGEVDVLGNEGFETNMVEDEEDADTYSKDDYYIVEDEAYKIDPHGIVDFEEEELDGLGIMLDDRGRKGKIRGRRKYKRSALLVQMQHSGKKKTKHLMAIRLLVHPGLIVECTLILMRKMSTTGLKPIFEDKYPYIDNKYYARHIWSNITRTHKGQENKDKFWALEKCQTLVEFNEKMEELQKFNWHA